MKKYFIFSFILLCLNIYNGSGSIHEKPGFKAGDKAPDFAVNDPSDKPITLSSFRGKLVLLDFWASWCGYCKIANQEFIPIYNQYKAYGFEIFSVSVDAKKEAWVNAIKSQRIPWPSHGAELKGWEESNVAQMYSVGVLPSTFLIDENGLIIETDLDEADLEKKLNWYYHEQIHFFPQTAASGIFFTEKTKYEIVDEKGSPVLKGKDSTASIAGLPAGEYWVKYENKTEKLTKVNAADPSVTFSPAVPADNITFSREAQYALYTDRGRLLKQGKAQSIDISGLNKGMYYLYLEGSLHRINRK